MTYTCALCKGVFDEPDDSSEEEKLKELKDNFGDNFTKDDCDVICDDCYNKNIKSIKSLKDK